eukprot:3243772-Amphidinium_carterae.1
MQELTRLRKCRMLAGKDNMNMHKVLGSGTLHMHAHGALWSLCDHLATHPFARCAQPDGQRQHASKCAKPNVHSASTPSNVKNHNTH